MDFQIFTALVAFLAVVYAGVAKFIQNKLVNRDEVEAFQKKSKELSENLKKAQQTGNQKKIDEAMKKQMEFLPKMNEIMMAQFKPMIIILGLFFALNWVVTHVDPTVSDDITIMLSDDGTGCDKLAGDGIFSACHEINNTNYGKWTVTATAFEREMQVAKNQTYFFYNPEDTVDTYIEKGTGAFMKVETDKEEYFAGEAVLITAEPANMTQGTSFIIPLMPPKELNVDKISVVISNGTYFSVELPLTIPVFNVKTIYQPYWWFILISLITNLSISIAMGKLRKKK